MKLRYKISIIFLLGFFIFANNLFAQANDRATDSEIKQNIKSFLQQSDELTNYSENGFTSSFTDTFIPIQTDVQTELNNVFPNHSFYVAKMLVSIDPPASEYELIVIVDNTSKKVISFLWSNYWMIRPSKSFSSVFDNYKVETKEDAVDKVQAFAKLISSVNGDKIGKTFIRKKSIEVELLRGEGVMGVLLLNINKNLRFKEIYIANPDRKKIRTFTD